MIYYFSLSVGLQSELFNKDSRYVFRVAKYHKKSFHRFNNTFHVYLMRGFQKHARNWILTMPFWATREIAQPINPIWQHIFALPWSALKKPPCEFISFHIFGSPHQVDMKNVDKCWKDFLCYFTALETYRGLQIMQKFCQFQLVLVLSAFDANCYFRSCLSEFDPTCEKQIIPGKY